MEKYFKASKSHQPEIIIVYILVLIFPEFFYATIYPSSALSHILHMYIPKYVHLKLN